MVTSSSATAGSRGDLCRDPQRDVLECEPRLGTDGCVVEHKAPQIVAMIQVTMAGSLGTNPSC